MKSFQNLIFSSQLKTIDYALKTKDLLKCFVRLQNKKMTLQAPNTSNAQMHVSTIVFQNHLYTLLQK